MMGIQDYDCPQESVLIDTHEGYVLSDRKKTRKRKIAQFINLLLIGLGRPLADIFCKVIPHPGPIPNCLAVDHCSRCHQRSVQYRDLRLIPWGTHTVRLLWRLKRMC